jgi:hypothetical protein
MAFIQLVDDANGMWHPRGEFVGKVSRSITGSVIDDKDFDIIAVFQRNQRIHAAAKIFMHVERRHDETQGFVA